LALVTKKVNLKTTTTT